MTTLERSIKKRNHKIYIDYLQNRKEQTLAAPYSVRPFINKLSCKIFDVAGNQILLINSLIII
jgi:hypothetical protein